MEGMRAIIWIGLVFAVAVSGQTGDTALPVFTPDSLAAFDGAGGRPTYVAVQGKVYDLSAAPGWKEGGHETHKAGRDLTDQTILESPHGLDALSRYPVVGRMAQRATGLLPDSAATAALVKEHERNTRNRFKTVKLHRTLALTTAGLVLAADVLGAYHFIDMIGQGHRYRDSIGYDDDTQNETARDGYVKTVWARPGSQGFRVLHGATVALATIGYAATATMELGAPKPGKPASSARKRHRALFAAHAACMAANIGLGFVESWALSRGNHEIMGPVGEVHMVVGIAVPVLMVVSGLTYGKPE